MAEIPDEVAALWGLREPPRRGRKAALTADEIVRAAIAVADAEGLPAVSMARVAAELGNATMALYRHVRSKDELITLMADAAIDPPDLPPVGDDWREALRRWAHAIVAETTRHPWYPKLPITGPPIGPNNLLWFDAGLAALAPTGLPELAKVGVIQALSTYAQGQIRLGSELAAGYADDPRRFGVEYGAALARLIDPARYPALSRAVASGIFLDEDAAYEEVDEDFDFGLDLFLDGVAALVGDPQRSGPSAR